MSTAIHFRGETTLTLLPRRIERDGIGAAIESPAPAAEVYADYVSQNSRAFIAAQARHAETTRVFRVRTDPVFVAGLQLTERGHRYEILENPIEDADREFLLLTCRSVRSAA